MSGQSLLQTRTRGRDALGIVSFLILAFGLAWIPWMLLLPHSAPGNLRAFELAALPGAFAPALATFIVRKWITREGFADAGLGLHLRKWPYYLIAWFLPFPVLVFIVFAAPMIGAGHADLSMTHGLASLAPDAHIPPAITSKLWFIMPLQATISAPFLAPGLFGEEFGWRGYLQLRLFASRPTLAAVATGIIWGLWHLPIILRGYEFPGDPVIATAAFCVGTVLIAIIFGWLREKSGSVWVTSLAHSATNGMGGSLAMLMFPNPAMRIVVGYLGYLSWIPLGLLCVWIVVARARRDTR
jgi:membrane protease YdiL (CAAX protease family)